MTGFYMKCHAGLKWVNPFFRRLFTPFRNVPERPPLMEFFFVVAKFAKRND